MKHLTNERLDVALSRALAKATRLDGMKIDPLRHFRTTILIRGILDEYVRRHRKVKVKR